MGFWHTGYMEFHEPDGLGDFRFELLPPAFRCAHCDKTYFSIDELRIHRFESHPLRRPTLFLNGQELGADPVRVTCRFSMKDVSVDGCDRAFLNGNEVPVDRIPHRLVGISSDVCRLVLSKADLSVEFKLDFRIASEEDLFGVETQFERTALGGRLDVRAIEEFISSTSGFKSAIGYTDGICSYLYGVLAKERAPDSSLAYHTYVGRFSRAAEELATYERSLAVTIVSLIEFHFNHFEEASRLGNKSRVGRVAERFATWMQGKLMESTKGSASSSVINKLEALVTDWETEQIVGWAVCPLEVLSDRAWEIESFLKGDLEEYDKVKVHMLLGEMYARSGKVAKALQHAKALRNLAALEKWAESLIMSCSEDRNDEL